MDSSSHSILKPRPESSAPRGAELAGRVASLNTYELLALLRECLALTRPQRRVDQDHARVLRQLVAMDPHQCDIFAIYKALGEAGRGIGMSKLYRTLMVLVQAGLVERRWNHAAGRARCNYVIAQLNGNGGDHLHCCPHCGEALA